MHFNLDTILFAIIGCLIGWLIGLDNQVHVLQGQVLSLMRFKAAALLNSGMNQTGTGTSQNLR